MAATRSLPQPRRIALSLLALALAGASTLTAPSLAMAAEPAPALEPAEVAPPPAPAALDVPWDGKGMMAFGGVMLVGGSAATGLGAAAYVDGSPGWGVTGMVVGIAGLGIGLSTVLVGVKRQREHRAWQLETKLEVPRSGHGMIGAGIASMFGGGVMLGLAAAGRAIYVSEPLTWTAVAVGATSVVTGTSLFLAGATRNARYNAWRKGRPIVVPSASFSRHGGWIGISGRF